MLIYHQPAIMRLAATLLDLAADQFSNHGCNDFRMPEDLEEEDLKTLVTYLRLTGDEEVTVDDIRKTTEDWVLMLAIAKYLRFSSAPGSPY